jgi:hypothetical protein
MSDTVVSSKAKSKPRRGLNRKKGTNMPDQHHQHHNDESISNADAFALSMLSGMNTAESRQLLYDRLDLDKTLSDRAKTIARRLLGEALPAPATMAET